MQHFKKRNAANEAVKELKTKPLVFKESSRFYQRPFTCVELVNKSSVFFKPAGTGILATIDKNVILLCLSAISHSLKAKTSTKLLPKSANKECEIINSNSC